MTPVPQGRPARPPVISQRLDHLFRHVLPPGRSAPYTHKEAAQAINAAAGHQVVSAAYLWQLRTGKRADPAHSRLSAIARFFGVTVAYFYDDAERQRTDEQLQLLALFRDDRIRHLALAAAGLPPGHRDLIARVIAWARLDAGLPAFPGPGDNRPAQQ